MRALAVHTNKSGHVSFLAISPALRANASATYLYVLVYLKSTSTPPPSLDTVSPTLKTMATSRKSTGTQYPTLTFSSAEAHAKTCPLLESDVDSTVSVQDSFTNTSEPCMKRSHNISSGKMLKALFQVMEDETSQSFSIRWPKLGILSGGKFSTPKTSVSLRTANASLSSVLETEVQEKYYLSEERQRILEKNLGNPWSSEAPKSTPAS